VAFGPDIVHNECLHWGLRPTQEILMMTTRFIALALCCLSLAVGLKNVCAAEPQTLPLWKDGAPGALGKEDKDIPKTIVYRLPPAAKPTAALVILPGGGYGGLAMDHEGHQIARWANELGMSAFICDYRHRGKGYGHPYPLLDAQRLVRMVRSQASGWNVDPQRIGIIGFSAGGHLCSTVLTHFDGGKADAADPIDRAGSRPDFGILCYPVIDFDAMYTHKGSQKNLLGEDADEALVKSLSNSTQVTNETPPAFLWHTAEDKVVPIENSLRFYSALSNKGVLSELHCFPVGRHGLGLAAQTPGASQWPELCHQWLVARKVLDK
jgi:acetyl esterase/lipase